MSKHPSPPASPEGAQTQRVELIAFPSAIGDELRSRIKNDYGHDCLRFRSEQVAPDVLQGESLVRCIWIENDLEPTEPEYQGTSVAIGRGLSDQRKAKLISLGFIGVIDLEYSTLNAAAGLASAYATQAARRASETFSAPLSTLTVDISPEKKLYGTQYLAACVEFLEIGVYALDESSDGTFVVWNAHMERLFEKQKDQVIGLRLRDVFEDPVICDILGGTQSTFSQTRTVIPSKTRNRSNFIADIGKTLLLNPEGQPTTTVGILQDVTGRIQSENRLIAAFNELETSKEKLEQSNLQIRRGIEKAEKLAVVAQSSNKAKSYFLSNVSHELRTPLNSIVSLTHALLEGTFGPLNEKQLENLKIVSDSSKHLHSLIVDILDLSKIELGKMSLRFAPAHIEDIARSTLRMIEQEASLKQVRCTVEINTDREEIEVDSKRLRQILLNLLVNAVKFTKPQTTVTLRIEENSDTQSIVFKVIDHGIGIRTEDFSKIFSPFTQLDDSLERQYEGTGLGLAIASKFVELHGGSLGLESDQGKGSTFTVSLPVTQAGHLTPATRSASLSEIASGSRPTKNLLLIVDEIERSALRIQGQVRQFSTFNPVLTTPSEISAYRDQVVPEAIFVDLNITHSHGTDWIASAQSLPAWRDTKWIAVCSMDLPESREEAKKLGLAYFATRPIPNSFLVKILR